MLRAGGRVAREAGRTRSCCCGAGQRGSWLRLAAGKETRSRWNICQASGCRVWVLWASQVAQW